VALITIDLASAIYKNPTSPEVFTFMHIFWLVVYWSVQLLAWIIIPILQSYVDQGHFSTFRKILGALFENVILYIVFFVLLGAVGAAVLVFLIIKATTEQSSSIGDLFLGIPDMVMQASNIFGMTLVFLLIGYGVVALPRSLWHKADHRRRLDLLAFRASHVHETLDEKREKLAAMMGALNELNDTIVEGNPLYERFHLLMKKKQAIQDQYHILPIPGDNYEKIKGTRAGLVKFNKKFIKTIRQFKKKLYEMAMIEDRAFFVQDIIRAQRAKTGHISGPFRKPKTKFFPEYRERLEYLWYCKLHKPALRVFSLVVALFCMIVLWCELSIIIYTITDGQWNLSVFSHLVNLFSFNRPLVQMVSLLLMAGMISIIYFAMFEFRFSDFYALIPGHSDSSTMLFTAVILTRVIPALLLNFVLILHAGEGSDQDPGVAFFRVNTRLSLDKLRIVVVAEWILDYYPLLILIVALVTLCAATFLSRLAFLCSNVHDYVFHRKKSQENIHDGMRILTLAKKKRAREMAVDYDSEIDHFDKDIPVIEDDANTGSSPFTDDDDATKGDVRVNIGGRKYELKEVRVDDDSLDSSSEDSVGRIGRSGSKYSKSTRKRLEELYKKAGKNPPMSFRKGGSRV